MRMTDESERTAAPAAATRENESTADAIHDAVLRTGSRAPFAPDLPALLAREARALSDELGTDEGTALAAIVEATRDCLDGATVTDFVPVLAHREAKDRLLRAG